MINPINVAKIFVDRASNLSSSTFSDTSTSENTTTNRECEVAELLCGVRCTQCKNRVKFIFIFFAHGLIEREPLIMMHYFLLL